MITKVCNVCKEEKTLEHYHVVPDCKFNRRGVCKKCFNSQHSAWYYKNQVREIEKSLDRNHLKKYGIERKLATELKNKQNNQCTICTLKADLCLDHNHKTGAVRGFLCSKCNQAIGLLQESTDNLERAIMYLKRNSIIDSVKEV